MIYLENNNLSDVLTDELTIVDFYASWCGPCRQLDDILKSIDIDVKIIKVDIDKFKLLTYENRVMSIPTMLMYKNKKKIKELVGVYSKDELEEILSEYA